MDKLIKKQPNLTKILAVVLIVILAIGIIIGGIATYNNSKKELIPSNAFDFAAMTSYQDYIGQMTLLMYDAERIGSIRNEKDPFLVFTVETPDGKNYHTWVEKLDKYEKEIGSFLNSYRSNSRQESNALYNESVEWGESGLKALKKMKLVFDPATTTEDKLRLSQEVKAICEDELRPLDVKVGNRITDVYNKYMREMNYAY